LLPFDEGADGSIEFGAVGGADAARLFLGQ
jgi:hypothetical protein